MADYNSKTKSNMFRVTDIHRFKELAESIAMDNGMEAYTDICLVDGNTGTCRICGYGSLHSVDSRFCDSTGSFDEDLFYNELSHIIAPGDVAVFIEIGSEKLRDIAASAVMVYHGSVEHINLYDEISRRARETLCNEAWTLNM